jgi:hypothetical protein
MKKTNFKKMSLSFFLAALAFLVLSSFSKVSPASAKVSPSFTTTLPGAMPYNFQNTYSLDGFIIYDNCTGEFIDLSGTEHDVYHGVYNPNTGTSTSSLNANLQGVSGVGESTGNKYQVTGTVSEHQTVSYDGCTYTESFIENYRITTSGPANNFYIKYRITDSYNFCTGEYTVTREVISSGCQ